MGRWVLCGWMACAAAFGVALLPAHAEDAPGAGEGEAGPTLPGNVNDLLAPESRRFTPGIRMGAFIIQPKADVSAGYDDNVFARPSGHKADTFANTNAEIQVISDWSRHTVEFYAGAGGSFYEKYDGENQTYANVGAAGFLDIQRGLWIKADGKYGIADEQRGYGKSTLQFDEPIETHTLEGNILAHKQFNRLWAEFGGGIQHRDFSDAQIGGVTIDQSFRDGTIFTAVGRTGYEVSPKTSGFVESSFFKRDFQDSQFEGDGYTALAGVRHEVTRLVVGEAAVGYLHFGSTGQLSDIDTWTYRGKLSWGATPLMTIALVGERNIGFPTNIAGASNTIDSTIGIRADYALRRDLTLTAGGGYGWLDYVDVDRSDSYFRLTAGAEYQFWSKLSLWANYAFTQYDSDIEPNVDYEKNVVMVGLRARY